MSRADLGSQYSGWQAVDATPQVHNIYTYTLCHSVHFDLFGWQEISPHSKSYVVGPASLTAIKAGQSLPYDTNFVIAEVNADIKDYCEVGKGTFVLAETDTRRVGARGLINSRI